MADPLAAGVGLVLLVTALAAVVFDVVMIVAVLRRRDSSLLAFWLGAGTFIVYGAYLFTFQGMVESGLLIFFFAPVLFGFLLMIVALVRHDRSQPAKRTILMATATAVAFALMILISVHIRTVHRETALMEAVLHHSSDDAVALLRSGAAHRPSDAALRAEILRRAASDGDAKIVAAVLEAGTDPNGTEKDRPLTLAAWSGNRLYKPATEEDALRSVQTLLDHGANPNAESGLNHWTAVQAACKAGRWTVVRLLRSKGANHPCEVPDGFVDLMIAARGGDVARVKELAVGPLQTFQRDADHHSPLLAAVESNSMDTIDALIERYQPVKDEVIDEAMGVAIERNNITALKRLISLHPGLACHWIYSTDEHHPDAIRALKDAGCKR